MGAGGGAMTTGAGAAGGGGASRVGVHPASVPIAAIAPITTSTASTVSVNLTAKCNKIPFFAIDARNQ